jgi:hypothetical protein
MGDKKRFSLMYIERGKPGPDSERFRKRLSAFYFEKLTTFEGNIISEIHRELGATIPYGPGGLSITGFFEKAPLRDILDSITIICELLKPPKSSLFSTLGALHTEWLSFVKRVLKEENLHYRVDNEGVVHYLVDEEFERNRISVLNCLKNKRYEGVRAAFEDAHSQLDSDPINKKAAVRSMFESIEILTKLMVPVVNRLNKSVVQKDLKGIALQKYVHDEIASKTVGIIFDGFSEWVDALHNYRHGQGKEEPVEPPLGFAVYVLSSGASFLRWLIEIDQKN